MTPKINVKMVDGDKKLKEVLDFIIKTPYSRYPVFSGDRDKIVGALDVDDVLKYLKNKRIDVKVKSITHPVMFVPESKEIDDLLTEFEGKNEQLAIVVDEYGEVAGIVTIEDILEEIVGEIFDKSDRGSKNIKNIGNGITKVNAKAPLEEVNRVLKLGLRSKRFNTLAGFIQSKLQRIPVKGEKIKLSKAILEIDKVTPQGIQSVKIYKR